MSAFFTGIKAEFKKVIWPDKKSALKESVATVIVAIVIGLLVAVIDKAVQFGLGFILPS